MLYVSPTGKKTEVGRANGIEVYTPNIIRKFMVSLLKKPGVDFKNGTLHVDYTTPGDTKTTNYAEADLPLKLDPPHTCSHPCIFH